MSQSSKSIAIATSILAADFRRLREEVQAVDVAGADGIYIEVMDVICLIRRLGL